MAPPILDAPSSRERTLHASGTSDVFTAPLGGRGFEDGGALVVVKRSKITCARDIERFEREASLLASLAHECVVRPLGLIRSPPTYALVLPLHARGSLFRVLHNSGAGLSLRSRASLVADACAAVAHLHERGVVHRDVKPDNYLLREDGAAVLTDFNAAERSDAVSGAITLHARPTGGFFKQYVVGTLPYMAPELITRGGASGAALDFEACDMYSLGITVNEVLTRAVPYSDALTETAQLHTILEARYNHDALVVAITSQRLRPALPPLEPSAEAPPPQLAALVQKLWAQAA